MNSTCGSLAPIFEAGKVDVVFNGHVHNYQRSYPLRFVPAVPNNAAPFANEKGRSPKGRLVDGKLSLDKSFDGQKDTSPNGVIYLVTGAGGQHLYNPEQQDDPASWQAFTFKHVSKVHSLTVADIDGAYAFRHDRSRPRGKRSTGLSSRSESTSTHQNAAGDSS